MSRTITKILSLIAIGVLAVSMTACGNSSSESVSSNNETSAKQEAKDVSVGIVVKTATNGHFQDIAYGAMLAGKDLGIDVRVNNTTAESEIEQQVTICEDMISSGVDALILTPNDSSGVSAAVNAAHDAGIPFVSVDTEVENAWGDDFSEYVPIFIGEDYEEIAYDLAKHVCDKMGGQGNVIIIRGVDAASSSQARTKGIERALAEYDGINLIDSQSANFDQDEAVSTMSDLIQRHDDIDAVICCNDLMALGAITAFEENNIKVGGDDGVIIVGFDANLIGLDSIKAGKLYGDVYDYTILQGYYAVENAYALIKGESVPERVYTTNVLVTAENVDDYYQHAVELSEWKMGTAPGNISDYMKNFIEMCKAAQQ